MLTRRPATSTVGSSATGLTISKVPIVLASRMSRVFFQLLTTRVDNKAMHFFDPATGTATALGLETGAFDHFAQARQRVAAKMLQLPIIIVEQFRASWDLNDRDAARL